MQVSFLPFDPQEGEAIADHRQAPTWPTGRPAPVDAEGGPSWLIPAPDTSSELPRPRPHAEVFLDESDRFLRRAVGFMADSGIRQFLKVDRGLAPGRDTHRILRAAGLARVVVVDSNPMVLALARARMRAEVVPGSRFEYLHADLTDPDSLLGAPQLHLLDLSLPVGLLLGSVLHLVPDAENPYDVVDRLIRELAPGSYLAISHLTGDHPSPELAAGLRLYRRCGVPAQLRSRTEVERFFTGLELVEPGLLLASQWRRGSDDGPPPPPDRVACLAGVGRVPIDLCP